ncbi:MAG: rod shape-determining protein MreD [Lachnospiraceae bacterium]|nr:rod shape-determining protein MreD [Lachnospiraceae bacterium]MDD7023985.1 rod shape-determining protein MreD [Oscillospiraceae bacterium]MDY5540947.1 rod shape-determining protein MreD [Lachnospiraceae bacterium]MDY5647598.1 rod shape-determining protein MreD [Lachnospiraceae bacterium]
MLRFLFDALLIIICFILQNTIFQTLALASISPNLLVILTSSIGLMRGKKEGMLVGFFCGFMVDIFYGDLFGFYALVYMYIGYLSGFFNKIFYDDDIKLPMLLISASEFLYSLIVYVFLFMFRTRFEFGYYLIHIIIPELVYTIVVTLFLYRIINGINRRLERREKRSA